MTMRPFISATSHSGSGSGGASCPENCGLPAGVPGAGELSALLDACPDAVIVASSTGVVTGLNAAGLELIEAGVAEEIVGANLARLVTSDFHRPLIECIDKVRAGEKTALEFDFTSLRGTRRQMEMDVAPVRDASGAVRSILVILHDLARRRAVARQFIQAQKMESVGHLAGGVVHDFNNLIGIIMGFSEMLVNEAAAGSRQHDDALAVFHTAQRAAALTQQILIFSRDRTPQAQRVDLGGILVRMDRMLRRLLGENIRLVTRPDPGLNIVEADPVQIEQVLMNLTVNARDAMPDGGSITIETSDVTIAENDPEHPDIAAGHYALLSVTDTGVGMDKEIQAKIFEPFFTTKAAGHGTGLGLSTCQNIVNLWHGVLAVKSAPGSGSMFKVYLPVVARIATAIEKGDDTTPPPRGTETVLVVEDEPGLLALTAVVLQRQGYTVLKAANGSEALSIVHDRHPGSVDLVLTDVMMPEMGGTTMAEWLQACEPGIKFIYTSGYSDAGTAGGISPDMDFIAKPYAPSDLLRKIRLVLDRESSTAAAVPHKEAA